MKVMILEMTKCLVKIQDLNNLKQNDELTTGSWGGRTATATSA